MKMNYFVNSWRAINGRVVSFYVSSWPMLPNHLTLVGRSLLLIVGLLVVVACQQQTNAPLIVTQTVFEGGREVVVTRVVLQTVQAPVMPTAVADEVYKPVELDISYRGSLPNLDLQRTLDENAINLIENLFVGLTAYNHQTNMVEPELAYRWEVSDDGRIWTFFLREDVFWVQPVAPTRFTSGIPLEVRAMRQVVAADIVFAVERLCNPATVAPDVFILFIIEGCEQINLAPPPATPTPEQSSTSEQSPTPEQSPITGVRAVNDFVVEFTLTQPASYFLTLTSLWPLRPIPPELIIEHGNQWTDAENLMTSGPFVMSPQSLAGTRTILQRNPFWPIPFKGNVDIVNILYLNDDDDAFRLWESRNLDLGPLPAAERARMLRNSPAKVELIPMQRVRYVGYNFNSPAFRHADVRRAFGAAIDRERLVREIYGGRGFPLRHFVPSGAVGALPFDDEVGTGYSPDEARHLMASSPLGHCRFMPPITYLVSSSDLDLQLAELLRDMWIRELGCTEDQIIIEQVQFGTLLANTRKDAGALRPDIWDLAWSAYYPDAHNWLATVLHCNNSENRQNRPCSEVDDMLTQAATQASQDERPQIYRQVERMLFGPGGIEPISPLYATGRHVLRHAWLTYTPALFGGEQYDTYLINAEVKELERIR